MADLSPRMPPIVVERLPAEIDIANAGKISAQLQAAISVGTIVIADMTATTFCDCSGFRELVRARHYAAEVGCELRVVIGVQRLVQVWQLLRLDRILPTYPTVTAALASE